jgi:hypothetical protein
LKLETELTPAVPDISYESENSVKRKRGSRVQPGEVEFSRCVKR